MNHVDLNQRPVLADYARLKIDRINGEPTLLFPEGVLILNATAQAIVLLCDGQKSGHEIIATLNAEYEVDEAALRADVIECLADLLQRNLILLKS
jgi:pyrroloquinoline quinone biosynthesis protein D